MSKKYAKVNVVLGKKQELTKEQQNCDWLVVNMFQDEKDKKISDLEAKLAESKKSNEYFADRVEKADKEIKEIYKKYNKLVEEYNNLKEEVDNNFVDGQDYNKLKQQLAETEHELDIRTFEADMNAITITKMRESKHQDKISFALEQLEKVKDLAHNRIKEIANDLSEEDDERLNQKHTIHGLSTAITDIDNQIKQLKEIT